MCVFFVQRIKKFENPVKFECTGMRIGCYDKLGDDGMPTVGMTVNTGDLILGKTITTTEIGEGARRSVKRDNVLPTTNLSGLLL